MSRADPVRRFTERVIAVDRGGAAADHEHRTLLVHQEARTRHDVQFWIDLARQFRPHVELCDTRLFREQFLPSSVDWYTDRCTIRSRDDASLNVPATEANFEQYNDRQFYLQPRDHSVYDGEGTGARYVVHVAVAGSGEVEIQYHFFYPFNGGFAIRDDLNEKLGTHEGD